MPRGERGDTAEHQATGLEGDPLGMQARQTGGNRIRVDKLVHLERLDQESRS